MGHPVKKRVNGRRKGHNAERALAARFTDWWGTKFTRTPLSGGFATPKFRDDWNAAGDLVTPDPTFPYCVENKKVEGWAIEGLLSSQKHIICDWWDQTLRETPSGKVPLLTFAKNRSPIFACMRESDVPEAWLTKFPSFKATLFSDKYPSLTNSIVVIFLLEYFLSMTKEEHLDAHR